MNPLSNDLVLERASLKLQLFYHLCGLHENNYRFHRVSCQLHVDPAKADGIA